MKRLLKAAKNLASVRIYEYVSNDGVTYWSLRKQRDRISKPKKLYLQNRIGKPILQFLTELRKIAGMEEEE